MGEWGWKPGQFEIGSKQTGEIDIQNLLGESAEFFYHVEGTKKDGTSFSGEVVSVGGPEGETYTFRPTGGGEEFDVELLQIASASREEAPKKS